MRIIEKSLFKNKNFTLLITAQTISVVGNEMQYFAFALYVLNLTGSGTIFASILAIGLIPQLIVGPISGVLVDWLDRKKIIVYLDFLSAIVYISFFIKSMLGTLTLSNIYLCVILTAIIQAIYVPAVGAIIPSIVNDSEIVKANSAKTTSVTIGALFAPLMAGCLYGSFGIKVILLINSVSFLSATIMEILITLKTDLKKLEKNILKAFINDFKEGFSFINNHKVLRLIVPFAFILNTIIFPACSVGTPYLSKLIFKFSDYQFGIVQSISIVGLIIGALITPFLCKKIKVERLFVLSIHSFGIILIAFALEALPFIMDILNYKIVIMIIFALSMLIASLVSAVINVSLNSMLQQVTPNNILGRVSSIAITLLMVAVPFGQMIYGIAFDNVNISIVYLISAALLFLLGIITYIRLKKEELI